MARCAFFDAGPIITLSTTGLLWILEPLKKHFKGSFCITKSVHRELVDNPVMGKRFKLEALQVEELVEKGVLELVDTPGLKQRSDQIMRMANKCLGAHGHALHLMHGGECETLAAASLMRAEAIFIDERITRLLVESPERLAELMGHRLHTRVNLDNRQVKEFRSLVGKPDLMRSAELVLIAYEKGLLDRYKVRIKNVERELVDSLLWGVKLHGCAISVPDIEHLTEEVLR